MKSTSPDNPYLNKVKAGQLLGISTRTLCRHRAAIGFTRQFGRIYFHKKDLIAYLTNGKNQPRQQNRTSTSTLQP